MQFFYIILNIVAYAYDLVLLALSWNAYYSLVSILHPQAIYIDMTINIQKTVAMVFTTSRRRMIVSHTFPSLKIHDHCIVHTLCRTVQISWSHCH